MAELIEDPDFKEFTGAFVDNSVIIPQNEYDYTAVLAYIKDQNKPFSEITKEEIEKFRI